MASSTRATPGSTSRPAPAPAPRLARRTPSHNDAALNRFVHLQDDPVNARLAIPQAETPASYNYRQNDIQQTISRVDALFARPSKATTSAPPSTHHGFSEASTLAPTGAESSV
ncbi:hypothetical protein QQZ08_012286 [Neonectria magnoliae]|uniref:Uncharacterized protein n=1 Tax=Neonectria magnoliae TaxID=2732573 RepID=A0ABR1H3M1_9HYPO